MSSYSWQTDQTGWYNNPQAGATSAPSDMWGYDPSQSYAGAASTYYTAPANNESIYTGGFYSSGVGAPGQNYEGQMFYPSATAADGASPESQGFEDEPPLLEELGINFDHIREKTLAVLNPMGRADPGVIGDQDLAGPLVFCLLFGGALLLHGKVHFGYIYGIGVLGCLGMYALLNLMDNEGISVTCTISVLGYCLLPMGLLSLVTAVFSFKGMVGLVISGMAVLWCSSSAAKLFVTALNMDHQQLLVAYPCFLLYGVFALLAVF